MQEDHVRHDRGAEDAGGQYDALPVGQARGHGAAQHGGPVRVVHQRFNRVAGGDRADERGDERFERAKSVAFQAEYNKGDGSGDEAGGKEGNAEEQVHAHGGAEEFGQVRGHGDDFHERPQAPDHGAGILAAADFGEIAAGRDAEFGRQALDEHSHQIADGDHPEQRVAVLGAGLDVGCEVAGIHVGDAGDEGRSHEKQNPAEQSLAAAAGEDIERRRRGGGIARGADRLGRRRCRFR